MKKYFNKLYKNSVLVKKNEFNNLTKKILKKEYNINIFNSIIKNQKKIFCIETGQKRSVINLFLMSRWNLKNNCNIGKINGLKKKTW